MSLPSSGITPDYAPGSSSAAPISTGEQQAVLQDSRVPQMNVAIPSIDAFTTSSSGDISTDDGIGHSAPRIERRYFPDGSDTSDEVQVITSLPLPAQPSSTPSADAARNNTQACAIATKLETALQDNDHDTVRQLLAAHPAAVNTPLPASNSPPLVAAVRRGQIDIVRILLEVRGIHVDARDDEHRSAVQVACETGHLALTRLLVKQGADLTLHCKGSTPLIAACQSMHPALLDYVVRNIPRHRLDFRAPGGKTALVHAIECGNIDAVKKLIAHGADPNRIGTSGVTPLHVSADLGHLAMAQLLIRKGAVPSKMLTGYPLDLAIRSGCLPMVELLLMHPPAGEDWKALALETAINAGEIPCITRLLAGVVSPATLLPTGRSPLMLAADLGNSEIAIRLLAHGADASQLSPTRHTALSRSIRKKRSRNLILLLLSAMPEKVTLEPRLAAQLIRRAKRCGDQRILNEMAAKRFEDQAGRAYDVRRLLN